MAIHMRKATTVEKPGVCCKLVHERTVDRIIREEMLEGMGVEKIVESSTPKSFTSEIYFAEFKMA